MPYKNKIPLLKKLFFSVISLSVLTACDQLANVVTNRVVTVDTNAYYAVYQKSNRQEWGKISSDNFTFGFKTFTFSLDDSSGTYGVVFVCPSSRTDLPNEVHVYYSTNSEMQLIDFNCRKSLDDIVEKPIYGSVKNVAIAEYDGTTNPNGEIVHLALSNSVSFNVWEAFGAVVRTGTRDIVGIKGKLSLVGAIKPEKFLIRRKIQLAPNTVPYQIDIDFGEASVAYFTKNFDENSRSMVNISGKKENDTIQSSVVFLSRNKTALKLEASNQENFSFLPVPLGENTGSFGLLKRAEFNDGEGHELLVQATSSNGATVREVSKFFTQSDGLEHNVRLPESILNPPKLELKNVGDVQRLALIWNKYLNGSTGEARMYRWTAEGLSAEFLAKKKPVIEVEKVKWYITVTPGWLRAIGATGSNYSLVVPTQFKNGIADGKITETDGWRKEWSFKADTPVNWEMSAISVSENSQAGEVVEYLLNRNIKENLQFSQVYYRAIAEP